MFGISHNGWRVCEVVPEGNDLGERVQRSEPHTRLLCDRAEGEARKPKASAELASMGVLGLQGKISGFYF